MARRRAYDIFKEEPKKEEVGTLEAEEEPDSPGEGEKMEPGARTGTIVNTPLLRVRDRPSLTKSSIIAVLQEGDVVKILDNAESRFYKIEVDEDTEGYIASKFCREDR